MRDELDIGIAPDIDRLVASMRCEEPGEPTDYDTLSAEEKGFHLEFLMDEDGVAPSGARSSGELRQAPERLRVMSTGEMLERPPKAWTIDGLIPPRSFVLLVGKSGVGKTFLAFDIGAHMSLGRPWMGRCTKQTKVLYVALEGFDESRIEAWCQHHGIADLPGLSWLEQSINLKNRDTQNNLIAEVENCGAGYVVLDTLNRSMANFDENSSADMGKSIEFADRLRIESEAGLIIVHHTPRDANHPRGHSSLENAADTILSVKGAAKATRQLQVTKHRNAPNGAKVHFRIVEHPTGGAFVSPVSPTDNLDQLTPGERDLVQYLVQHPTAVPGTHAALQKRAVEERQMPRSSFNRALNSLGVKGLLENGGSGRGALYDWTGEGEAVARQMADDVGPI